MEPKYVVYQCENCGGLFYREVKEVLIDDVDDCHVKVELLNDNEGNLEEFPMCPCLGGDAEHVMEEDNEAETDAK